MNDTPEKGTSPLNFGGSTPFSENEAVTQPESLDNGEAGRILAGENPDTVFAEPATDHDPVTGTQPAELTTEALPEHTHSITAVEDASAEQVTENLGSSDSAGDSPVATENEPEQVGEVTSPSIEQEETTPVVPDDVSTIPAADLAPNAEVSATPQTELEAEVAKELEVHASNPAEAVATDIPEEAPVIVGNSDADIEKQIAERDALNARIEENMKNQRVDVITQIKKVVETYKIPLPELAEALGIKGTRKGSKAKPKYRDPATSKEWSGRGKEPLWIKGQDRTKFLITA